MKPVDVSKDSLLRDLHEKRELRRAAWLLAGRQLAPRAVYSCGDCPVCSVIGDLLLFENVGRAAPFLYCIECGCAFDHRPTEVDSVNPREVFAPDGFGLPRASTVMRVELMGWKPAPVGVLDDEWRERFGPGFRESTEE